MRARERPFFMAEQLPFGEFLSQTYAIDRDERFVPPVAPVVDGPRKDFFTRATFAQKQHRRSAGGGLFGRLDRFSHLQALTTNQTVPLALLFAKAFQTSLEPLTLQSLFYYEHNMVEIEWLRDEIKRSLFHRLHSPLDAPVSRDHDCGRVTSSLSQLFQHFESIFDGHLDIEDHQFRGFLLQLVQTLTPIGGRAHSRTKAIKSFTQNVPNIGIVIRNQNASAKSFHRFGFTGFSSSPSPFPG